MAAGEHRFFFLIGQNKTKKKKRGAESAKVRAFVKKRKVKFLHGLKLWSSERPLDSKTFCQRRDRNDDDYDVVMKSRCASLPAPFQQGFLHKL